MNDEIDLNTFLPIYNEYNILTKNYLQEKLDANENLEEVMSKIHPKFKTPIKYRTKFFTSKDQYQKMILYKKPKYQIIDASFNTLNSSYSIDNIQINDINKIKSRNNKPIYCKTPIKDWKAYNKRGIQNYSSINTDNSTIDINRPENNNNKIIKKKPVINKNNIEVLNKTDLRNENKKKIFKSKKLVNYSSKTNTNEDKDRYRKLNPNKSYDNLIFKKKIKIIKKKKRKKIIRQKTFDYIKDNDSKNLFETGKNRGGKVNLYLVNKKYQTVNIRYKKKNDIYDNNLNKVVLIQRWWKNINNKRIEEFNKKFNKYKLLKNRKKDEKELNLNKNKRFLTKNEENILVLKKEKIFHKIGINKGTYFYTKKNYIRENSIIIFLQRKIKEYLYQKKNIIEKPIIKNSFISKSKTKKIYKPINDNFKIEYNYRFEIISPLPKNKTNSDTLMNIEKNEIQILYNTLIPKKDICNITKINLSKNKSLKRPLIKENEYISKIYENKKEYNTKNLNKSMNFINDYLKSNSSTENTILKSKASNKYNSLEEQNEIHLNSKNNNDNNNIIQKDYINKLNEFILTMIQKINKNVNQFIFYRIKYGKNYKYEKSIYFSIIKRIIYIYNNLLQNKNEHHEFLEQIKFINSNLSKNIVEYNKYNFISFIPKKEENDLINTQIFTNDDEHLINFIILLIQIEQKNCLYNIKNIITNLSKKYKLNNRNIFAIIRYADSLYKQILKDKNVNISFQNIIRHNAIKSFYVEPKFIQKLIYDNIRNNFFSFSYSKHTNFHIKCNSDESLKIIHNILLKNNYFIKNNPKNNIFFSITKVNKIKNSYLSSGEIDVFEKINEDEEKKEAISRIYDDYCFDKINKMNYFEEDVEYDLEKEKIKRVSKLSYESESEIINEIDCDEEDIMFNRMKQCFDEINK